MRIQIGDNANTAMTSDERVAATRATVGLCRDFEFAAVLGVSKKTIYRATERGLPVIKIGLTRWVDLKEAVAWLKANAQAAFALPQAAATAPDRGAEPARQRRAA